MPIEINLIPVLTINMIVTFTFLNKKKTWLYCALLFLLGLCVSYVCRIAITSFFNLSEISSYIVGVGLSNLFCLLYIHIVFEESFPFKLFTMTSIWLFSMIAMYASAIIINCFAPPYFHYKNFVFALRLLIQASLVPPIWFFLRREYRDALYSTSNRTIYMIVLFPILGLLVLANGFSFDNLSTHHMGSLVAGILLMTLIIWGYILGFLAVRSAKRTTELKKNVEMLTMQLELQEQNYKLINESIEKTRSFEHDIRHHISAVKAMLSEDKMHEALDYVQKLDAKQIENNLPIVCKNFTIDSLLKYFMSRCKTSNIDFKVKMNVPEKLKVDDLDLSIVLGNCIENAIEACEKLKQGEKRCIVLGSGVFGENLVFKMKNTFNGEIEQIDNRIKSSKGDRLGIGLSSVKQIVLKYDGNLKINYTEDIFEVCIVL